MGQIKFLSEKTINQIAAGEVIENPASVIKELIENSIDAGALKIEIDIIGGGYRLIRISDNGKGMDEEDALLSIERHATSKLLEAQDLYSLTTMGFRGEALASIASISEMTLTTATAGHPGVRLEVEGGVLKATSPHPRTVGTTLEIRALFYNVPVRKKFQKSASASSAEIHRQILLLSLVYPEISFVFKNEGSLVFELFSQTSLVARIEEALGKEFLGSPEMLEKEVFPYTIFAFLGSPHLARQNRSGQHLFVNHRLIHSLPLSFAVKEGYGTRIDRDKHPVFVLHVKMPASLVDINVHPQKREVRFQEEQRLKEVIRESLQEGFRDLKESSFVSVNLPPSTELMSEFKPQFSWPPLSLRMRETPFQEESPFFKEEIEIQVIGLWENYLFLQDSSDRGILVFNLSAAEEKLAFENLQREEKPVSQGLLIPIVISLSQAEIPLLENQEKELRALGFSLEWIGKKNIAVNAIPACLKEECVEQAIHRLIEGVESPVQLLSSYVRTQKKRFMLQEAISLVKKIKASPGPLKTARGEPIEVVWEKEQIERLFHV